jgi:uncharacterized membrane protein YgdD (TMEM256/DUF423 family)
MNPFALGSFTAALAVVLGAFGAHALAGIGAVRLGWWSTATQYLFVAAFGLMLFGLHHRTRLTFASPAMALLWGALFFSGSLYAMGLGGPRWLGAVTPVGGVLLIVGFVWLGMGAMSSSL